MTPALAKRIRRHVVGREHEFFAVAAPGLEDLCRGELAGLGLNARAVAGGAEFSGRLDAAYRANLHLRTASRVLMRLFAFRATSFRSMEEAGGRFPWELYLPPDAPLRIQVATHHCRLHHTAAIAERLSQAIGRRLSLPGDGGGAPADPAREQQVFVRGLDDRFLISLDASGANLYLRGVKSHPGRAPLRETIAAACLMRAGFRRGDILLDPMCGTGSFALEAALIAKQVPAGWFRDFACMRWPAFRPQAWEHLKRRAAERIETAASARIFASDIDHEACRRLRACLEANRLADAAAVACRDFFDIDPARTGGRPGVVALNPPYGRRLGRRPESRELWGRTLARLAEAYGGWKFVLIAPEEGAAPGPDWPHRAFRFPHGGLMARALVGKIP
jgi:putative N6-adenine-specific DNA methylase